MELGQRGLGRLDRSEACTRRQLALMAMAAPCCSGIERKKDAREREVGRERREEGNGHAQLPGVLTMHARHDGRSNSSGARTRRQKRGGAPVAQGQEQRRHPDGLSSWTRGGGDGEDREALDRARWRARGSGGCRWRAMVGEGWIPRGIWWSGGAAGRMGQVPRF